MSDLQTLCNIGNEMEEKLKCIGIYTGEELRRIGSKEAYFRLKERYKNVCSVHLYTLQGAIDNVGFYFLSEDVKQDLKKYSDSLK